MDYSNRDLGIDPDSNIIIAGAQDEYGCPEFDSLWDPEKRPEHPESHYAYSVVAHRDYYGHV
jgi:hypothetical protein